MWTGHSIGALSHRCDVCRAPLGWGAGMSAGLVLGGRYRLDTQLGEGGFGSVWRGHDTRLDRGVAVKLLHAGVDVPRFKREAHALAQLSHPNIVAAYDFGIDGATAYLVLELITGR